MNELDISIISPYTGKESLPDVSYADLMYKHFCVEPIINQNILRYSFDNDKGYRFYTKPCLCFLDDKNLLLTTNQPTNKTRPAQNASLEIQIELYPTI